MWYAIHVNFIFSYFFGLMFKPKDHKAEPEDHLWFADHSLRNAALTDVLSVRTWTPLREYCVWWSQEIIMSTDQILWGWSLFFGFNYSITIFNFPLFVRSQLHILNYERQCKKSLYQHYMQCDCLSFTFTLPPQLTFQTSLPSHPLGHVLSPNSRVAFRPL